MVVKQDNPQPLNYGEHQMMHWMQAQPLGLDSRATVLAGQRLILDYPSGWACNHLVGCLPILNFDDHRIDRIKGLQSHEVTARVHYNNKGRITRKQLTKSKQNCIKFSWEDAYLWRQATHIGAVRKHNGVPTPSADLDPSVKMEMEWECEEKWARKRRLRTVGGGKSLSHAGQGSTKLKRDPPWGQRQNDTKRNIGNTNWENLASKTTIQKREDGEREQGGPQVG